MKKKIIFISLIVAAVYGGITIFGKDAKEAPPTTTALSVTVVSPKNSTIRQQLNVTGVTIPREEIIVSTELAGVRVKEVFADVGDVVQKGQKLAILDGATLQNQQMQLQSEYAFARNDFNRFSALKKFVSRAAIDQKRSAMQSAKARLDDANLNIKRSVVIAPDAGVVFERNATIGALVNANEPLYRIAQNNILEVEATVPEADLAALKVGQAVVIKNAGTSIDGNIRLLATRIDAATRMASVRIMVPENYKATVGLFVNASIMIGEQQGIILPATAIQQDSAGSFVWKVDASKKAVRLPITVLLRNNDAVMVENVPTNITVIARAGAFIKEGEPVNAVPVNVEKE